MSSMLDVSSTSSPLVRRTMLSAAFTFPVPLRPATNELRPAMFFIHIKVEPLLYLSLSLIAEIGLQTVDLRPQPGAAFLSCFVPPLEALRRPVRKNSAKLDAPACLLPGIVIKYMVSV